VYRSFNAIIGKVSRIASVEVVLELFRKKSVLLYGTETCPMKKSHIAHLIALFVANTCFVKIFNTGSKIEECQFYFNFSPVSDEIAKRAQKFIKYENSE